MNIVCRLGANCLALLRPAHSELSSRIRKSHVVRFNSAGQSCLLSKTIPRRTLCSSADCIGSRNAASVSSDSQRFRYKDDLPEEPFLLSLARDAVWALRSLFTFLVEQPSQLRYIEWPSFQSTLRTAVLTLILVALLIVALSSVDSALCYLLALFLRRTP